MMDTENITDKAYTGFMVIWHKVVTFIPDLIVAIVFLLVGWMISSMIKRFLNKTLIKIGFNTFLDKLGLDALLKKMEVTVTGSQIVSSLISIFFLLIFLLAALDIVGLTVLSGLIDTLVLFLPKLLASLAVLSCGFFVAQIVFNGVKIAAKNTGVDYGRSVAEVCRGIIIVITISLSITQLDIDVSLLNNIMTVVIASVGLAAAISLGIGTKSMAQEIVAGVYLREMYQVGDNIEVKDIKGTLASIGSVASKVMGENESITTVPNTFLLANKVTKQ
ncbi:mechanosensitive ion channel [Colwellia sp. 4_MG-2023]|uniref:mechanosensitive ion channel family protein n=1 Tax=unclassified Colwellia TaxID=196834 RepID=UPI00209178C7|nr:MULTISPECIES: mechanosensitive ion channel domain-containing protein [unclassified Colwellia]MDO6487588.1 mechanosensitive ion channel [Colwellia sp. 6_MG-2023]MDO6507317.1 mechanosensitive ion channel [Colwellia sp. 5_MG-2023]MDO6556050.1 mechanosensitive ion channel [Colwellia sp. 4_MG-2023]MDO6652954.1 mechanosensitive ion channel [Colwellia sp. 3_MG-2023]MDO6665436.1 mechanosensitive ion channel [Colwellia sp. 2_MG-2023]